MDSAHAPDVNTILQAASEFASYPGAVNDAAAKEFIDRYPLPVLFGVLQMEVDASKLDDSVVACLGRLFRTGYVSSLLLQYVPFIHAGLQANLETIRCLACNSITSILENNEDKAASVRILVEYNVYPLLINCLLNGNEPTSAASLNAIKNIATSPEGIDIIILSRNDEAMQLTNIADHCSSMLAQSPHSTKFLLKTSLLQLLTDMISNDSVDSILRSRAMLISGRFLYSADAYKTIDQARIKILLLAINGRLNLPESQNMDEVEHALEAVGQIGSSTEGAILLLTCSSLVAKHVLVSAFDRRYRGKQLAALHALCSIAGADRSDNNILLNDSAENCLKGFFYETAADGSKMAPSGLFLSVLQHESEIRLAAYRLISALVAREWCLMELCSKPEIVSIVINADIEDTKMGMEARHHCCAAICGALSASNLVTDAKFAELAGKLQEAVKRGPYLTKKNIEARPIVITADRI